MANSKDRILPEKARPLLRLPELNWVQGIAFSAIIIELSRNQELAFLCLQQELELAIPRIGETPPIVNEAAISEIVRAAGEEYCRIIDTSPEFSNYFTIQLTEQGNEVEEQEPRMVTKYTFNNGQLTNKTIAKGGEIFYSASYKNMSSTRFGIDRIIINRYGSEVTTSSWYEMQEGLMVSRTDYTGAKRKRVENSIEVLDHQKPFFRLSLDELARNSDLEDHFYKDPPYEYRAWLSDR